MSYVDAGYAIGLGTLALYAASFSVFLTAGRAPVGLAIALAVLCLALRRTRHAPPSGNFGGFQKNFCKTNAAAVG